MDHGHFRPDTARSLQDETIQILNETEITLSFVGLVLGSLDQFRIPIQVDPEVQGAEDFLGNFYKKYLKDFDDWSIDLKAMVIGVFGISRGQIDDVERRLSVGHREDILREYRKTLLAAPKPIIIDFMTRILAFSLLQKGYDARTRSLLVQLKRKLNISNSSFIRDIEQQVLDQLQKSSLHEHQDTGAQKSQERTTRKWIFTGIGAVAGGIAVGLTAGLAAPFVFPALASAIGMSGLAAFFASAGGIATMSILFGAAGAGLTGYKVTRRFGDVEDFRFVPLHPNLKRMHATIGISGWLETEEDVWHPWALCEQHNTTVLSEVYALQFEQDVLLTLGRALATFITGTAASIAATELLKMTIVASAVTALMFPVAVLQSGDIIDNPWSIGMSRAKLAGQILADVLRKRIHGRRPIDLYGYSLGALVILSCLDELAKDPEGRFGIIENVILFGVPTSVQPSLKWHRYRCLVAGRFVHCYSRSDWVLSFLYRGASLQFDEIAGLAPLRVAHGIESVDFTGLVKGHLDYREKLPELLSLLCII